MKIISVDIDVEEMQVAEPLMSVRLNLVRIYLLMAWRGLFGFISKVKVSPVYGNDKEQEPDLEEQEPNLEEFVADAFKKASK